MPYTFNNQIDFLLENACPVIRYLVHRDFLKTSEDSILMQDLYEELLQQKNIKDHFSAQHSDCWMGYELHGNDSIESHIGTLINSGVRPDDERIKKAINALLTTEISSQHKNCFKGGAALDAEERGGNKAIIAKILSWVKYSENEPILAEQIKLAYEHLSAVLKYDSVDDFSVCSKSERYYKPKARFPGSNHIGLLDATQSWRSEETTNTAKAAMKHGYYLMKDFDEYITFKKPKEYGGGFVGPFNYNWQVLKPIDEDGLQIILNSSYRFQFGFWLRSVSEVPDFARQSTKTYELIADLLEEDKLFEMIPSGALDAFKSISGREPSWRKKNAAKCDVTFAVLRACWNVI